MNAPNLSRSPLGRVFLHVVCLCRQPASARFFLAGVTRNLGEWQRRSRTEPQTAPASQSPGRSDHENSLRQELQARIAQRQRDERCVQRAVWLMALLTALTVAGVGYGAILADNCPFNTAQFILSIVGTLGLACLVCLLAFAGLGIVYRLKLDQERRAYRQFGHEVQMSPPRQTDRGFPA
jgi:hypothetical protein